MTTLEAWVSPLVEVERAVQERAEATNLDPAADGGPDRLRVLIEEEVARWSEDHKRGLRPFDLADPATVAEDQPGNSSKRDGLSGSTRPC